MAQFGGPCILPVISHSTASTSTSASASASRARSGSGSGSSASSSGGGGRWHRSQRGGASDDRGTSRPPPRAMPRRLVLACQSAPPP